MGYVEKVEQSLRELLKKGFLKYREKKKAYSNNHNGIRNGQQIKGEDSDGKYTVVKSAGNYYSLGNGEELWVVTRVKEYDGGRISQEYRLPEFAVEALMRKANDDFAPWMGIKIGSTEMGYVPKEVYLNGKSFNIEHLNLNEEGKIEELKSAEEIYDRIVTGLIKEGDKNKVKINDKFGHYLIQYLKKYLYDYIASKVDCNIALSPEEREKLKKEAEEIIWFVEKRVDKVS